MSVHNVIKKLVFMDELRGLLDAARSGAIGAVQGQIDANTATLTTKTSRQWSVATKTGNYTLVVGDELDKIIDFNTAGNCVLTLPSNATAAIPTETPIPIRRRGTGTVQISAGAGATIVCARTAPYMIAAQYGEIVMVQKTTANEWWVSGGLT